MPPPPPKVVLQCTPNYEADRAEILHSLWGILCATFGKKNDLVMFVHGAMTSQGNKVRSEQVVLPSVDNPLKARPHLYSLVACAPLCKYAGGGQACAASKTINILATKESWVSEIYGFIKFVRG